MNLSLTDDQRMIRDSAQSFLADASDSAAVRAALATETGFDAKLWQRIGGELGWCGTAIPEQYAGLGLGPVELSLILEQMGRHLLCAPFFSSVCLAGNLLLQAGSAKAKQAYLPRIADGSLVATAAFDGELKVSGTKLNGRVRVPDGATAELILLVAGKKLFSIEGDTSGLSVNSLKTWDGTRRFAQLVLKNVSAVRVDDPKQPEGIARAQALSRLYLAAEQLGGAQQCLDLIVRYTAERRQFGRAIASFQAVKHRCAELMVKVEGLRSLVYGAAALAASDPELEALAQECAATKALASDIFFHAAGESIQLHGGVGFTTEFDPQLYFKRAQVSSHWLGAADALREDVARVLTDAPSPGPDGPSSPASGRGAGGEGDFRKEVAGWMKKHLAGRFAKLKHRGGPGDEEFEPALRKQWEHELAKDGWSSVGWPKEAGGRGLSIEQQVIFHEEYARAGGPGRISLIGQGLLGPALIHFGSESQKKRFLPRIVDGTEYWAQGYSEPGAGSDLANVQTRCWQEADGSWRVSGQKIWTSFAHEADWIFVLARSEAGTKGPKGLTFLLMPLKQPGISIRPIGQMSGGSEFNEVFFDHAVAQDEHVVGGAGNGWKVAMGLLEAERGVSTLGQQMHFAYELDLVIKAAKRNGSAKNPQIRQRLAQAWGGLRVLRYNALRMLAGAESTSLSREALIFKYNWSNWHRDLGKLAADVLGFEADVISDDPDLRRLQQVFLFSRADTIYAGTNEIQLNLIAERGLGMPKEPRGDK